MGNNGYTLAGIATSLLLSALTLGIFALKQMDGPEGKLHMFFDALKKGDEKRVLEAVSGDNRAVALLANEVVTLFRNGARYDVIEVKREDNEALALVEFRLGRFIERSVWFLKRSEGEWRIDANRTALASYGYPRRYLPL